MKRLLINLLTALSLLLFVAVAVLWVRSCWTGDSPWSAWVRVDGGGTLHRRSWTVTPGAGAVDVYCVWGSTRQREFEPLFRMGRQGEYARLTDADRAEVARDVGGPLRLGPRWSPRDVIGYSSAA